MLGTASRLREIGGHFRVRAKYATEVWTHRALHQFCTDLSRFIRLDCVVVQDAAGFDDSLFDGVIQFAVGEFHGDAHRVLDGVGIGRGMAHDANALDSCWIALPAVAQKFQDHPQGRDGERDVQHGSISSCSENPKREDVFSRTLAKHLPQHSNY